MQNITRHIPNLLTIGNLLSGVYGIILVMQGDITAGTVLIWIGAIFDFADGFAARVLKAYSEIGRELDSLADMVTFGILPALVIYSLLRQHLPEAYGSVAFAALFIPAFSALRLAKFNIDPDQKENFRGLPTPANAFLLSGIPFYAASPIYQGAILSVVILVIVVSGCILMVSNITFPSLKFRTLVLSENSARYLIIISALIVLVMFRLKGITPAMILYILISLVSNILPARKSGQPE